MIDVVFEDLEYDQKTMNLKSLLSYVHRTVTEGVRRGDKHNLVVKDRNFCLIYDANI